MFFVGIAATTLFSLVVSFFSAKTDHYIGSLGSYFFYFFFGYLYSFLHCIIDRPDLFRF